MPIDQEIVSEHKRSIDRIMGMYMDGTEGWLRFMRDELLYTPDKPLLGVVDSVAKCKDTALRSSHGVGKTTFGANALLTALTLTPELLALQISPTWGQVKGIFWNELRKWYPNSRLATSMFEIADKAPLMRSRIDPQRWYSEGKASNSPGKIEGKHAKRVLLIGDEAKAIPDDIFEAVQGALTSPLVWRLYLSTPTTPSAGYSQFYYCFTKNRAYWDTYKISAQESPRVSAKWIQSMYNEYGKESQVVEARVHANFPDASGNILIPLQAAEAMYNPDIQLDKLKGPISIGVDVARFGDDETVIAVVQGSTLIHRKILEKNDTMEAARETMRVANTYNATTVVIDDIGVGGGLTDVLKEKLDHPKYTLIAFVGSRRAKQKKKFKSLWDEVLWEFAQDVKNKEFNSYIDDEQLVFQLAGYQLEYTANNQIKTKYPSKKSEGRASEQKSPDRAVAAVLAHHGNKVMHGADQDSYAEFGSVETNKKALIDDFIYDVRNEFAGIKGKDF